MIYNMKVYTDSQEIALSQLHWAPANPIPSIQHKKANGRQRPQQTYPTFLSDGALVGSAGKSNLTSWSYSKTRMALTSLSKVHTSSYGSCTSQ